MEAWPWRRLVRHQIDDLAARESRAQTSDGVAAKENNGTRKEDGDLIGPAAYLSTCGDGLRSPQNGPCQ